MAHDEWIEEGFRRAHPPTETEDDICPGCGQLVLTPEEEARYDRLTKHFNALMGDGDPTQDEVEEGLAEVVRKLCEAYEIPADRVGRRAIQVLIDTYISLESDRRLTH